MAYKITDDCVACGSCADECPNDAIISGDDKYEINADECLDCGTCATATELLRHRAIAIVITIEITRLYIFFILIIAPLQYN